MRLTSSLHLIVLTAAFTACNQGGAEVSTTAQPALEVQKPSPTAERLLERSKSRWDVIVRKDWIAAYDYLSPEQRKDLSLQDFLRDKSNHLYANPRMETVLKLDGENGYLRGSVLWTPQHPQLTKAVVPPGQTLTQELQMVETWRWADGDWQYVSADRDYEFLEKHPDLLKDPKSVAPADTAPKGAAHPSPLESEPKAAAK